MTFLSLISLYLPAKDYEYKKDVLKNGNNKPLIHLGRIQLVVDEDGCKGGWEAVINIESCIFSFMLHKNAPYGYDKKSGNWSQVREKSGNFKTENE